MSQVAIETKQAPQSDLDRFLTKNEAITEFENTFSKLIDTSKSGFDQAIKYATDVSEQASTKAHEAVLDREAWLESAANKVEEFGSLETSGHGKPNLTVCFLRTKTPRVVIKK